MIVRLPDVTPPTFKLAGLQKNATGNWTLSFPSIMADKFKNHPGLASKWTSVVEAIYKKYGKPIGSTPQRDDGQGPHEQDDDPEASALPGIDLSYMAPPIITAKQREITATFVKPHPSKMRTSSSRAALQVQSTSRS